MSRLHERLDALTTMMLPELEAAWQDQFGEAAPALPPSLLRRAIGHQWQEEAFGGLPAAARRMLDLLAKAPDVPLPEAAIRLKTGTRLVREWNGETHTVLVTDDGLLFRSQRFRSLSHVARAITGAQWSGPRFFGLKRPVMPPPQGKAHG